MVTVAAGLAVVGVASLQNGSKDGANGSIVLGLIFIISGQLLSATQIVLEEVFLKSKNYQPLNVVGVVRNCSNLNSKFLSIV